MITRDDKKYNPKDNWYVQDKRNFNLHQLPNDHTEAR